MRAFTAVALTLLFTATVTAQTARTFVNPRSEALNKCEPPFSGAVRVGDTLYLSGQIGLGPDHKPPAETAAEAKLVMDAVKQQLTNAGMTMDDLVSVQIFCSDVRHYDAFNAVYRTYFTKEFPARAFIGSGGLLFGARFEVVGIAVKR